MTNLTIQELDIKQKGMFFPKHLFETLQKAAAKAGASNLNDYIINSLAASHGVDLTEYFAKKIHLRTLNRSKGRKRKAGINE